LPRRNDHRECGATEETHMADLPTYPGAPRWVKVFGIVVGVLALLIIILMFAGVGGPHGPGRHLPSGDADGDTPSSNVTEEGGQP
jgi:hypothetical protein